MVKILLQILLHISTHFHSINVTCVVGTCVKGCKRWVSDFFWGFLVGSETDPGHGFAFYSNRTRREPGPNWVVGSDGFRVFDWFHKNEEQA